MNKKTILISIILSITCFALGYYGATKKYTLYSNCVLKPLPYTVSWDRKVGESVTIQKGNILFNPDSVLIHNPMDDQKDYELSQGNYMLLIKESGGEYQIVTIIVE